MKQEKLAALGTGAVLVLLALLNALNFTDRYLVQAFAIDLIADLRLTNFQFTLLTGFVFTVFYTLMALLMGVLADRYDRPRLIAFGVLLWSILTGVMGLAHNFLQAAAARTFIGVGEATLTPAAIGMLGDVVARRNRAFAAGVYYLGAPVGIGGAYLIAGSLGPLIGWRPCFYALSALGLVLTLPILFVREPRAAATVTIGPEPQTRGPVLREVLDTLSGSPAVCLLIAGGTLFIFALGALVLDQVWLVQERGFTTVHARHLAGGIFLIGGVLGTLLGGIGGDLLQARRAGGRLYFLGWLYLCGLPVCYGYRFADPSGTPFVLCMFLGSMLSTMGYGPLFASLQDMVPERIRSTMIAVMILSMMLLGTSLGNLLVGWLADQFSVHRLSQPLTWAAVAVMSPGLLAVPCFFAAARLVEQGEAAKRDC